MRVQGQLLYAHIMDMKIQVQRLYGPYLILTRRHHTVQSHQASQYLSPESSGIIGNLAYQLTSSSSNLFYAKSCQRIDANSSWLEYGFHKASTENMQVKPAARHSIARTYPWLQSIWHHCDENQAPGDRVQPSRLCQSQCRRRYANTSANIAATKLFQGVEPQNLKCRRAYRSRRSEPSLQSPRSNHGKLWIPAYGRGFFQEKLE